MITTKDIREAMATLEKYRAGKAALESRVLEDRRIWRKLTGSTGNAARGGEKRTAASTAWLFNLIANKHADAMDAYPEAIITGRESADTEKAKLLSDILPVICEHNGYAELWSELWWSKLIDGTSVTGVFWNNDLFGGEGDISLRQIDLLNIYWEPGIRDIEQSHNVFTVEYVLRDELAEKYPRLRGKTESSVFTCHGVTFEELPFDEEKRCTVIDWYYKKAGRLHFCKFAGDEILYASENDSRYAERGWYDHGRYPFVFDKLYPECRGICGFGSVDVGKNPQKYIDKLDSAIIRNAMAGSKVRYFVRSDGGINEAEFADTDNELIHVSSSALGEDSIRQVVNAPLGGIYTNVLQMKIDELKETGGSRAFNQGGTYGGVTSGTAIAALQEAGNKLSRDVIAASYRAFERVNYLMIELIRQFYTRPRAFRIVGERGGERYVRFDNRGLCAVSDGKIYGLECIIDAPVFDVKVFAQKASPFSREVRNERAMQLYNAGFFKPERREEALAALEMMDFEGKDKVLRTVGEGSYRGIGGICGNGGSGNIAGAADERLGALPGVLFAAAEGYDAQRKKMMPPC